MPGIINYKEEYDYLKLWVPRQSDIFHNIQWLEKNTHHYVHDDHIILSTPNENDNILMGEYLQILFTIHQHLNSFQTKQGITFKNICHKIPLAMTGDDVCMEFSVLELWASDGGYESISQNTFDVTHQQIIATLNGAKGSNSGKSGKLTFGIFGLPFQTNIFLGGIQKNEAGMIVGANALKLSYVLDHQTQPSANDSSLDQLYHFEKGFTEILMQLDLPKQLKV